MGSLSAAGSPKAYVGLFKDDAVAVPDTAQNKVFGTIAVPKGPHGLVVTPDSGWHRRRGQSAALEHVEF
jgi:YVTN family beta-propeller protein